MSPENVQAAEVPAEGDLRPQLGSSVEVVGVRAPFDPLSRRQSIVAFKFGGTSLLGAKRMLHAAGLVRPVAQTSQVVVVVSAMKGVTDRLLAVGGALENGKFAVAREEADGVVNVHLSVLRDLHLEEDDELRVRREMQSLCRDLLHDASGFFGIAPRNADAVTTGGEASRRRRTNRISGTNQQRHRRLPAFGHARASR